jgi:hypothetical protein
MKLPKNEPSQINLIIIQEEHGMKGIRDTSIETYRQLMGNGLSGAILEMKLLIDAFIV